MERTNKPKNIATTIAIALIIAQVCRRTETKITTGTDKTSKIINANI